MARVESGLSPYAIAEILPGSKAVTSHFPTSRDEAVSLTGRLAARGRRYSVGLMQITSTNFRHYGVTASDLLDPCTNLSV
ncbi:transglycosylase SLT domain-containing protein, partial [Acinetobacter baumannii]